MSLPDPQPLTSVAVELLSGFDDSVVDFHRCVQRGIPTPITSFVPGEVVEAIKRGDTQAAAAVHKVYTSAFSKSFVAVISPHGRHDFVRDDANVLDSIIELGGEEGALLQQQLQPIASGVLLTRDPKSETSTKMRISATPGRYHPQKSQQHDIFVVDSRTGVSLSSEISSKQTALHQQLDGLVARPIASHDQKRPTLTPTQIRDLTTLALDTKRLFLKQLELHWAFQNNAFIIEKAQELSYQPNSHIDAVHEPLVAAGRPVIPGLISGTPVHLGTKIRANSIVLAQNVNRSNLQSIKQAAALLCKEPIVDRSALTLLQAYHIPTVDRITVPLKQLSHLTALKVDARSGKIYTSIQSQIKVSTQVVAHDETPDVKSLNTTAADGALIPSSTSLSRKHPKPLFLDFSAKEVLNNAQNIHDLLKVGHNHQNHLSLVVGDITSFRQAEEVAKVATKTSLFAKSHYRVWFELVTPAAIDQVENLIKLPISGVILNTRQLHTYAHGGDTSQADFEHSPVLRYCREAAAAYRDAGPKQAPGIPVGITLGTYDSALIKLASDLSLQLVITKPELVKQVKQGIMESQEGVVSGNHHPDFSQRNS